MSSVQFGGLISGLNTSDIISALVAVEKQPLTRLQNQETTLNAQKAAYTSLGSALADLQAKIKAFTDSSAGAARSASSSAPSVFSASASAASAVGQYQIIVDRLASATRATSMGAIGQALVPGVDTSLTLDQLNMATPITAGQVSFTVDGTTVQVAVGAPGSTTLQGVIDGLANALQAQLALTGDSATVTASIVGNHLQLSISGGSGAAHTISFGSPDDTSNAAAALGLDTAGVTGAANATIAGGAYLDPVLTAANTPGSITGGQISAVVDGVIVHYTVGDPSKTTMSQLLDGLAGAIQSQLRAGGPNKAADGGAVVTGSVVANHAQLAVSGSAGGVTHSISFGAAGDTSNALGILGFDAQSVTNVANPTIAGPNRLGVVRTSVALDQAGLTGLAPTTTGKLTINGVDIAYDTTKDSLTTVITRINNSTAGVVASLDRANDTIILTRKDTGSLAIDIDDTSGTLAGALNLAPGTTNAQSIGQSAQIRVDGRTVVSSSNTVTNAIDGVAINLLSQQDDGLADTLTVGVDKTGITNSINAFISSFNSLGDLLDKLTASTPGTSGGNAGTSGPLTGDPTATMMFMSLRDIVSRISPLGGTMNTLGAIGINTGKIGSPVGTTSRLQLDATKLSNALGSDPSRVAALLDDATNGLMKPLLDRIKTYQDDSNPNSYITAHTSGIDADIKTIRDQEANVQDRIAAYQATLEAKYAALESTLALLQSQSAQVSSQVTQMNSRSS